MSLASVGSGSAGFKRFAENLKTVFSREAEIAQDDAVRRSQFRASLVEEQARQTSSLAAVFAYHRARAIG